jgi:hypothetical protein
LVINKARFEKDEIVNVPEIDESIIQQPKILMEKKDSAQQIKPLDKMRLFPGSKRHHPYKKERKNAPSLFCFGVLLSCKPRKCVPNMRIIYCWPNMNVKDRRTEMALKITELLISLLKTGAPINSS